MTAHDPRVTLTEAEVERIVACLPGDPIVRVDLFGVIADLIAARLAPIRAVAEQWDTGCAREVLAALDVASAPVNASQDHDGAEGQGEGERAADRRYVSYPDQCCPGYCVDDYGIHNEATEASALRAALTAGPKEADR